MPSVGLHWTRFPGQYGFHLDPAGCIDWYSMSIHPETWLDDAFERHQLVKSIVGKSKQKYASDVFLDHAPSALM